MEYGVSTVDISVVVLTRNSEHTIEDCLKSVMNNEPLEIIVIDGYSTDKTVKIAQKYAHKIYYGVGRSFSRQLGAEKARDKYVAYVDSNVILPRNCLSRLLLEKEKNGYAAIQAQVLSWENKSYWQWAEDQIFKLIFNKEGERDYAGTITCIFDRDVVVKHEFDVFSVSDDMELCYRLKKLGYRFGLGSVPVYRRHPISFMQFAVQKHRYGRAHAGLVRKHKLKKSLLLKLGLMTSLGGLRFCIRRRLFKLIPYYLLFGVFHSTGVIAEYLKLWEPELKRHG